MTDSQGRELAARFSSEPDGLRLKVDERGAKYPITIDPLAQQAYLKPAAVGTTQAGDWFGYSVAVSGDTVVVGAPQEDSSSLGVNSIPNELAAGFVRGGVCIHAERRRVEPTGLLETGGGGAGRTGRRPLWFLGSH